MLDGAIDGYEPLRGRPRRPAAPRRSTRSGSRARTCSTAPAPPGRPKGVKVPLPGRAARRGRRRRHRARRSSCSAPTSRRVYLSPAPLYHAAPLRFCRAAHRARRHRGRDGALRSRAVPRARRAAPRHLQPGRARRCSSACSSCPRRCARRYDLSSLQVGRARGRAVPGRGEGADHRVVRADHPRVLRRHRGQRLRVLQQRGLARPPGHGRQGDPRHDPHRRRRRRGGAHRRVGHRLLRGRGGVDVRVPQRRREDGRLARPEGPRAGARSATSATSTTTASSTSPTARRT